MKLWKLFSTAALATLVSVPAFAQQPVPVPAGQPAPARPAEAVTQSAYRAKQVLGTKVFIQGNETVGTVDDIVFDDSGAIEYLIVNQNDKLVTIPWEAAKFNFEKRMVTLDIAKDKYQAIPTYTIQQYPVYYAPAYRTSTYKLFNLTPVERRIIRRDR